MTPRYGWALCAVVLGLVSGLPSAPALADEGEPYAELLGPSVLPPRRPPRTRARSIEPGWRRRARSRSGFRARAASPSRSACGTSTPPPVPCSARGLAGWRSSTPRRRCGWRRTCRRPGCGSRRLSGSTASRRSLRCAWRSRRSSGIPRHLEASLWFAATGLIIASVGLVAAGLLCIAAAGIFAAPHAAHDLGDAISGEMPAFARVAFLGSLVFGLPLLGEGLFGLALALLAIGVVYGRPGQRVVLAIAAACVIAGAYPVARLAGSTLLAFGGRSRAGRGGLLDPRPRAAGRSRPARGGRGARSARARARSPCRRAAAAGSAKRTRATRR